MRGSPTEATQLAAQSPTTGLGQSRGGLPPTTRVEWLLLLILFFSASNIRFYMRHAEFDENWREAAAFLLRGAHPGDEVVIVDGLPQVVFDHYRQTSPTAPDLIIVGSADAPIPSPLPEGVWFMGSTRLKPDWECEAHRFLELHRQDYCYVAPTPALDRSKSGSSGAVDQRPGCRDRAVRCKMAGLPTDTHRRSALRIY